ncbi:MAG TPA: hypothetical protein DCQ37_19985, partial [Desulfobacteraceae bacterium]|nr:hypothetical protein [Desulfobacteraceae bacterium]
MNRNILKRWFFSMSAMVLAILLCAGSAGACQSTPTIRSVFSGDWNDSKIWNTGKVPDRSDVVSIEAGHTVTASYIRVKGLCNAGTLSILSDAVFGVVTDDFIYNNGKIISAVGATHLDDWWIPSPPGQTIGLMSPSVQNAQNGVIEAGQGGYSWQWIKAQGGAGGDVLLYGYTILNEGTITGGQGGRGDAFRERWSEAYGGSGGSVVVFARDKASNTGKIASGAGGGAIDNGDGVAIPGGVGNVTFSALSATQSGVIQGNIKDSTDRDSDNDGNQDVSEVQNGTNPFGQDIVMITGNGYSMVVTPYLSGHEVPMKITQESDGSYKGDNGIVSIVMKQSDSSRSRRDNGISTDYAFTISKSLTG